MIHIHDTEGNLLLPNPRLCTKTGYEEEELARMEVWELDQERSVGEIQASSCWRSSTAKPTLYRFEQ